MIRYALCALALLVPFTGAAAQEIRNGQTVVRAVGSGGACVGFDVAALKDGAERTVAEVRWTSAGRWTCAQVDRTDRSLRFSRFSTTGTGTPTFGPNTAVTVSLAAGDPYPRVDFRLDLRAFDEAKWRNAWTNLCPMYFLRCSLPEDAGKAQMFYQHGILYPGPEIDPYPITMGPMRGDWCERWSYAPSMGASPVPAVGLWAPEARLFTAYEFAEPRLSDRSEKHIASSYCAGLPDHPGQFFTLSYPYAENMWGHLRLPAAPATVATRFRILYSTDMPSDNDPNRFVIRTLTGRYADRLPPAPRMNDMAWLKQDLEGSQIRFLHDLGLARDYPRENVAPLLFRPYEQCEKPFFDPGAVQLAAHQTGKACRYAWSVGDTKGLAELKKQVEELIPQAVEERYGDDVCYVWKHPLKGQFKEGLGGARATGTHHMFNWGIASAMLWFYRNEPDPRYLPFLDGMVKWTRHYLYDRAGMADLPWAVFSMGAANGGEFLLDYYYTFREDAQRRDLAQEALRLAEMVVYRNSYPYLGDPIETDALDPSFLLQAVNSAYWIGAVTWGEMGRVPEMWIRIYLETGDPLLKYLIRGCFERFYMGTINSAGAYTENLLVFSGGELSGGWGANNFRWLAEPLAGAIMQVDVGPKAAIAFCRNTRAVDVAAYRYGGRGNCSFTVVVDRSQPGAPDGSFDIMVTSPHESISGKTVSVNGAQLSADRFVIGSDGVNALIRGVKHGDVVTIGSVGEVQPAPLADFRVRRAFDPIPSADWLQVDLRPLAGERVDDLWSGPWGGLIPGPRVALGVEMTLLDPSVNGGKGAVSLRRPVTLNLDGSGPCVIVLGGAKTPQPVFGGTRLARVVARYTDGSTEQTVCYYEEGAEIGRGMQWYDKEWWLRAYPIGRTDRKLRSVTVEGDALLFAASGARSARAKAAAGAMQQAILASQMRSAYHRIQAPSRVSPMTPPWADSRPYRFLVRLHPPRTSTFGIVRVREDLKALFAQIGLQTAPDASTIKAYAIGADGKKHIPLEVQFCADNPKEPWRGDLLVRLPQRKTNAPALVAVYLGGRVPNATRRPSSLRLERRGSQAMLSNGLLSMTFELSGQGIGPRMIAMSGGPQGTNWLGPTGHDAGYAHLCACQDGVTWYDFGSLQDDDATVEVLDAGPLAMTVRFGNLKIYGEGSAVAFAGVGTPGRRRADVKGVAEWYVRLYAGEPRADNWVACTITNPYTGWTRPMEVRYAQSRPVAGMSGGSAGKAGAWAKQGPLAIVALDERPDRDQVSPYYTDVDGNLVGVHILRVGRVGRSVSDVWRIVPPNLTQAQVTGEAEACGVEQWAVEQLRGGRVIRTQPRAVALPEEKEPSAWSQQVVGKVLAMLEAGSPDAENGLRNKDNPDEGISRREKIEGVWCITPGEDTMRRAQQFVYFDVSPEVAESVRGKTVFIAVEMVDRGRGSAVLHYDSLDETVHKSVIPGAFKDAPGVMQLNNAGKRVTYVFPVADPRFSDGCNGADFRLQVSGGPYQITRVALLAPPE